MMIRIHWLDWSKVKSGDQSKRIPARAWLLPSVLQDLCVDDFPNETFYLALK